MVLMVNNDSICYLLHIWNTSRHIKYTGCDSQKLIKRHRWREGKVRWR